MNYNTHAQGFVYKGKIDAGWGSRESHTQYFKCLNFCPTASFYMFYLKKPLQKLNGCISWLSPLQRRKRALGEGGWAGPRHAVSACTVSPPSPCPKPSSGCCGDTFMANARPPGGTDKPSPWTLCRLGAEAWCWTAMDPEARKDALLWFKPPGWGWSVMAARKQIQKPRKKRMGGGCVWRPSCPIRAQPYRLTHCHIQLRLALALALLARNTAPVMYLWCMIQVNRKKKVAALRETVSVPSGCSNSVPSMGGL